MLNNDVDQKTIDSWKDSQKVQRRESRPQSTFDPANLIDIEKETDDGLAILSFAESKKLQSTLGSTLQVTNHDTSAQPSETTNEMVHDDWLSV